jgi:hypothetical protein
MSIPGIGIYSCTARHRWLVTRPPSLPVNLFNLTFSFLLSAIRVTFVTELPKPAAFGKF